jgi:hypothetical protein
MSNHLAIATATAALRQVLDEAISAVVAGASVTHVRPGGDPAKTPTKGVNVFLYGVTPNAAWRNDDLPTRSADGRMVQRPRAALDLHYLISFYGDDAELETQRMMGIAARTLHARPTLPRQTLRDVVAANGWLAGSDLSEAAEAVRFTPVPLNLEELSKLWSVLFQTPYALSAAYLGTVVLLEAEGTPAPSLPVRARNVYAVPFAQPAIEAVESADGPDAPIRPGSTLVVRGQRLRGDVTRVRLGLGGEETEPASATPREVRVPLASVPAGRLRAGVQGVQVVHRRLLGTPPAPHRAEESNVAPFVLRPEILPGGAPGEHDVVLTPAAGTGPARVTVRLSPEVGRTQRVELLLNETTGADRPAFRYAAPPRAADGDTVAWDTPGLPAGTYLVRVRVDGAESLLEADDAGRLVRPRLVVAP